MPVVLAVGWGAASRVMEGAGSALDVGFSGFSRNSPVITLLLSLGPVLVPGAGRPAVRCARDLASGDDRRRRHRRWASFLLYFVRISEASWVGFRAGQILLVSIPILLACVLVAHEADRTRRCWRRSILVVGLPTTVVDTWNAQDISNQRQASEFRWTIVVDAGAAGGVPLDPRATRRKTRSSRWSRCCAAASTGR